MDNIYISFLNFRYATVKDAKPLHLAIVYAKWKSKRKSDKIGQTYFVLTYNINLVLT